MKTAVCCGHVFAVLFGLAGLILYILCAFLEWTDVKFTHPLHSWEYKINITLFEICVKKKEPSYHWWSITFDEESVCYGTGKY